MKKQTNKFPIKYPVQFIDKKINYFKFNPVNFVIFLCVLLIFCVLIWLIIKNEIVFDDFMFFLAVIPIIYVISTDMNNRIYDQFISYYIRLEKVKVEKKNIVLEMKNIGNVNVVTAGFANIKINGRELTSGACINLLPVNETITLSLYKNKEEKINVIDYSIFIILDNKLLLLKYTQKMKLVNSEYIIEPNTCVLRKKMYYKLRILL